MKAIILDFDGTIADSFEAFVEVVQSLTSQHKALSPNEIEELRKLSTKAAIRRLGIRPWQIPHLLTKGRKEMNARMTRIGTFEGLPEVISRLAASYQLYILSTNSPGNITKLLEKYGLVPHITRIYGGIGLAGKAKSLKKLLKQQKFTAAECVYIGDETRDIEAAHKAGLRCISVTWGFNSPEILRTYQPAAIADTPASLPEIIHRLEYNETHEPPSQPPLRQTR